MATYRIMQQDAEIDRVEAGSEGEALELHARRAGWRDGAAAYLREHHVTAARMTAAELCLYEVVVPAVPGAPSTALPARSYEHATEIAARYQRRPDLRGQDVVITRGGKRLHYAGPAR